MKQKTDSTASVDTAAMTFPNALRQLRPAFYYAFFFSFFMNIMMLLVPIYSLQVLDRVISSQSLETLLALSAIAVLAFIFYGLFNLIRGLILQAVNDWLDRRLAPRLLNLSVTRAAVGIPTTASQYQRDLVNIKNFISGNLPIILDAPWAIIFLFVIYMINPLLGFFSLLACALLLAFAAMNEWITKKPIEEAQVSLNQGAQSADVMARNAEAIEAMGMMPSIIRQWQRHAENGLVMQTLAATRSNVIQSCTKSIRFIIQIAITGLGAWLTLKGEMTVGGMIAASILSARALAPFDAAIGIWKGVAMARESYHRLDQVLATNPHLRGTMQLPAPTGHLTAEAVFFQPPQSAPIIRNINFVLAPGESLGIIGPSAAGKSTLAKLIIGILPTSSGSMRLDGMETFKWNREDLGRYVGYMPQHVDLFAGTIKDNIARMQPDARDEDVIAAAQYAGCHEMILRLPKGYETEFAPGSMVLSPGQRQRIGLARALYGNPHFVVLDEPNGNLDGEGERALLGALQRMKANGINFIVVAHRPSIVGNVDKVLMLRTGMVEAFGARDEVLRQFVPPTRSAGSEEA